jgi:DNA-binding LytR/AlgR family response regulator
MNHTMTYHLTTGKTLTTMVLRESFTDFTEKYLRDPRFIKPHASFVLNMDQVQVMSTKEFEMVDGEAVPISKRAYTQVRKQFMDYILLRHGGLAQ